MSGSTRQRHSYDFIFGECGSGKSSYIYRWLDEKSLSDPETSFFLFVPEQNTLKAQREIVSSSGRHGMLNLDVLSFQLLYYRIADELGLKKPVLFDDLTRTLLLRKACLEAESDGVLGIYSSKISSKGFISRLRALTLEFAQYNIDTAALSEIADSIENQYLKQKITDIREIYSRFLGKLNSSATVPEELQKLLLKHIGESHILDNAVVVFDGYTGFTPIQLELIKHILKKASFCRFAVAIPPGSDPYRFDRGDVTDIWWLSRKTISDIIDAASSCSVAQSPYRHTAIVPQKRARQGITVIEADDPAAEARIAARSIRREAVLNGRHYCRIACVLADPEGMRETLKRELSRYQIPYFMDDQAQAAGSPAAEFLRSAASMVANRYRYDDIANYIKNPLLGEVASGPDEGGAVSSCITRREADEFDNLMRRTGLRGRRAVGRALASDPESSIGTVISYVFAFDDELKKAASIRGKTEAFLHLMADAGIKQRLDAFAERLDKGGFEKEASENRRFMELILLFFERLVLVMGDEECAAEDYIRLVEAGLTDIKGGKIPETSDMVIVGDLRRSRLDDIDVLYIIGANDGSFPAYARDGGLFTDAERTELEELSGRLPEGSRFELAPDDVTDVSIQEFYLHSIIKKPNDALVVSYSKTARDRSAQRIAPAAARLIEEGAEFISSGDSDAGTDISGITSVPDALELFSSLCARQVTNSLSRSLYHVLSGDSTAAGIAGSIMSAAFIEYRRDPLSERAARLLYRGMLSGSVSRMESYERCPYAQFAGYGLRLKERESFDLEAVDIGNLFHETLDIIFKDIKENNQQLTDISDYELNNLAANAVERVVSDYGPDGAALLTRAKNMALRDRVLDITAKTLHTIKYQYRSGSYKSLGTELKFRFADERLSISGSIDRMDISHDESGNTLVRVTDYKTGSIKFELPLCLGGIQLQLAVYMDCALKEASRFAGDGRAVPAGMFYYHIKDPVIGYEGIMDEMKPSGKSAALPPASSLSEARESLALRELRLSGVVNGSEGVLKSMDSRLDGEGAEALKSSYVVAPSSLVLSEREFRKLMELTEGRIKKDASDILSGSIEARPYRYGQKNGCDYCAYGGICGFDTSVKGYRYRTIRKTEGKDGLE